MASRISAPRDPWGNMFPREEAEKATGFLVRTWRAVTTANPDQFRRTRKEPQLTEQFWWHLDQLGVPEGKLLGQWSYENYRFEFDPVTGEKIRRIRQDIVYFSNANKRRLTLVYEFKKLKATGDSYRAYQGAHGLQRFVNGYYAKREPVAAMVAMTLDDPKRCIDGLRRSLMVDGTRDVLCMLPDQKGQYLRDPSSLFADMATFDTEHKRPEVQAAEEGTISVAHLFLPLPPAN